MSSALLTPLADAVVASLNTQFSPDTFTAQRVYDAMRALDSMGSTLWVDIVVGDKQCEPLDRSRQKNHLHVDIIVRQVITGVAAGSSGETTLLDGLMALVESIDTYLSAPKQRVMPAPPAARLAVWQGSETVVPYSPKKLREQRLFYSLLRLSYLAVTDGT
jgi:hypothetical protein